MNDRRNISPADELGHIRTELKRLRARETELKAEIAETGQVAGSEFIVQIKEHQRRTLNREALPPEILEDDRYWKISTTRIVRTVPVREESFDPLIDDDDI